MKKKVLIDLRSIEYGEWGGIENVAYYMIDSLLDRNIDIVLDVRETSYHIFKDKYKNNKNVEIISDPIEGIFLRFAKINGIFRTIVKTLDKLLFNIAKVDLLRRRKKWANSIDADVVIYPNHLDIVQHENIPVISFLHAFLPNYTQKQFKAIETHIIKSKALITLWKYPYDEFISKYPQRKDSWFLIPCMLDVNINVQKEVIENLTANYWLYVSFFTKRKNHENLVKAYKIAYDKDPCIPNLIFVGNGDKVYYKEIITLINNLGLTERIKIYFGFLKNSQVAYLYENAKAVLAPTLWEAASGTVVEACLVGKPVACSMIPPLVSFANSFQLKMNYFNPYDINDIANTIIDLHVNIENYNFIAIQNKEKLDAYNSKYFGDEIIKVINFTLN